MGRSLAMASTNSIVPPEGKKRSLFCTAMLMAVVAPDMTPTTSDPAGRPRMMFSLALNTGGSASISSPDWSKATVPFRAASMSEMMIMPPCSSGDGTGIGIGIPPPTRTTMLSRKNATAWEPAFRKRMTSPVVGMGTTANVKLRLGPKSSSENLLTSPTPSPSKFICTWLAKTAPVAREVILTSKASRSFTTKTLSPSWFSLSPLSL
mmetsp:Transcript_13780/g.50170  ORF Transcript_13780/g.50170 Transcript_13780/m.50170 type:complete len:207 (-) Transcript_13780:135-755(-)